MTGAAVVFSIGSDQYAVAAETVREVVCDVRTTPLPTAPTVFVGAFNLRGVVVPVFDTAMLLGVGSYTDASVIVVLETPEGLAGITAGGLPKVVALGTESAKSELQGTHGVFAVGERYVVLIDVPELLTHNGVGTAPSTLEVAGG